MEELVNGMPNGEFREAINANFTEMDEKKLSNEEEIPEDLLPPKTAEEIVTFCGDALLQFLTDNGYVAGGGGGTNLAKSVLTLGTPTNTTQPVTASSVPNAETYVFKYSTNSNMAGATTFYSGGSLTATATGLTAGTLYYYTVTASGAGYVTSVSNIYSGSTTGGGGGGGSTKFIDSGLESGTSTFNSQVFEPDNAYVTIAGGSSNYTDAGAVGNTSYQNFYKSVRVGTSNFTEVYSGLANGNYTVHLHYRAFTTGDLFNVFINSVQVATNLAVDVEAGGVNRALIKSYNVTVSGGSITILHGGVSGQISLAGIEIVAQGTASKLAS